MLCDVLDGDWILKVQTVRLCLQSCLVDENSGVGIQAGECEADVGIDEPDLGGCDPCVLQLHSRALLTSKDNNVFALNSDGACSCCSDVSLAAISIWSACKGGAPLLTASPAYSTWNTCPSGLQCVSMRDVNVIERG